MVVLARREDGGNEKIGEGECLESSLHLYPFYSLTTIPSTYSAYVQSDIYMKLMQRDAHVAINNSYKTKQNVDDNLTPGCRIIYIALTSYTYS